MDDRYTPDPAGTPAQRELARHMALTHGRRDSWEDVYAGLAREQLIPPPPIAWRPELLATCDELYQIHIVPSDGRLITSENLQGVPAWVFLEYLTRHRPHLLHGSNRADIEVFMPRTAGDTYAGGDRPKVYAASSGIMAMIFAIIDRRRLWDLPCVPAMDATYATWKEGGDRREGFWFIIDHRALPHAPWENGAVYVLSRESFAPDFNEMQWYSVDEVPSMARVLVGPEDFPLLHEVRGIDWFEAARRGLMGYPFRDDPVLYPR